MVLFVLLWLKCFEQLCWLIPLSSWNDLLPFFQDWQHSRLSAVDPLSALTVYPLYLWPDSHFILFYLLAICLPLFLTLYLNFLSPRTVSYPFSDFLKCLAHSRCSIYVGWNEMTCNWDLNSVFSNLKCTKPHSLFIDHWISQFPIEKNDSPSSHTRFIPFLEPTTVQT